MAESYDELKKENEKLKLEREKDRKIIHALKDHVDKLKMLLKARSLDENIDWIEKDKEHQDTAKENLELKASIKAKDELINQLKLELDDSKRAQADLHEKLRGLQ